MTPPSTQTPAPRRSARLPLVLLAAVLAVLVWSAIRPYEWNTWALEVFPAVGGMLIFGLTYRRFPMTNLAYVLVSLHCVLLIVGGHYTYAKVPLGLWLQETFHLSRNHYDRLGHFTQGFVPAILAREVLLRCTPLRRGGWFFFLVLSVCLAVSAAYELVEWAVAEIDSGGSQAFLGTQGDVWDTQKDMALCLVGAVAALLTLSVWHDRQMRRLLGDNAPR